jgi:hypothetical protein
MTPSERNAAIYAKMHADRFVHIEEKRRARDCQAEVAEDDALILRLVEANAQILSLVQETAQRYSRGSVTRVALDNLALEISERL